MYLLYLDRLLHHTEYLIPFPAVLPQTGKDAFILEERPAEII